jgi:hypothetical protein
VIRHKKDRPSWAKSAHAWDDDVTTEEDLLLIELAGIVRDWPTTNEVVRAALDKASQELVALADVAPRRMAVEGQGLKDPLT